MNNQPKVSLLQISLLIITAIGLKNHVTVIPHLLGAAKRDSWVSVGIGLAIILCWCFLLSYIHRKTINQNIFHFVEQHTGKLFGRFFSIIVSLVFVLLAAVTLKEFISWTKVSYLPITPIFLCIILFTILCFLLAITNIQTIVILNTFVLTAVVVFGFFVAFANIQYKDHTLLKPILEHGFKPVISGTIYPLSGLIELIVLLFIQQKVHGKMTTKLFLINSVILAGLLLGPLIGSLTEFGPYEAARQKYPAFEQWGLVSLGRFIKHLDFLSIYQWITGAFIRISFFLFLSAEPFTFKSNKKKITLLAGFSVFLIISNLIPMSDITFYSFIREFLMPFTFWFFLAISIILGIIAAIANKKSRRSQYVQENKKETYNSK